MSTEGLSGNNQQPNNHTEWDDLGVNNGNDYFESEFGQKERQEQEKSDRILDKLDEYVDKGIIPKEHAEKLLNMRIKQADESIGAARQGYQEQQELEKWLQGHSDRDGKGDLFDIHDSFEGEKNINVATGKERTFGEFDNYPHQKGESSREYGDRLKWMHGINAEAEARGRQEDEERARLEAEERARLEAEERARLEAEERARQGAGENNPDGNNPNNPVDNNPNNPDGNHDGENQPNGENGHESDDNDANQEARRIEEEARKEKENRLKEINESLDKMRPDLAELYAKNRRLFVGAKNRADFIKAKEEYQKLLNESLKLKSELVYEDGKKENMDKAAKRFHELEKEVDEKMKEFVKVKDGEAPKSKEEIDVERNRLTLEANRQLAQEYRDMNAELKSKVTAAMMEELLNDQNSLEDETIDKLNNGSLCRKIVHNVINNKFLKGALIAAGVAGLAATGVGLAAGLAAGSMAVTTGFTATGVLAGAGRGALMGGLMSRQDASNSAVHGFASEEDMKSQLESVKDSEDHGAGDLAGWLMDQYTVANETDAKSNRKRTAISVGLGAAIGGLMSGVHVNNITTEEVTNEVQTGTTPIEYDTSDALDNINISKGSGMYQALDQMGVPADKMEEALALSREVGKGFGMEPGSNGVVKGFSGAVGERAFTQPGTFAAQGEVGQAYFKELAEKLGEKGILDLPKTGGEPIFDAVTETVQKVAPNIFFNNLIQATTAAGTGIIGSALGGARNVAPESTTSETTESDGGTTGSDAGTDSTPETGSDDGGVSETPVVSSTPEAAGGEVDSGFEDVDGTLDDINSILRERGENPDAAAPDSAEQQSENLTDTLKQQFGDRIGEEGISIMTSEVGLDGNGGLSNGRIANWWNSLDDATKAEVSQFEKASDTNSDQGKALRTWLMAQSL